jgi:hypothetical protein
MSRKETSFWKLIRDHVPGEKDRVENMVGEGMPDVSIAWNGHDYWIELKVSDNKIKLADPAHLCLDSQLIWHTRRGRQGTIILVMVKYESCIMIYKWKKYAVYAHVGTVPNDKGHDWDLFQMIIIRELRGEIA